MKHITSLLLLTFISCGTGNSVNSVKAPERTKNNKCIESKHIIITEIENDGVTAKLCPEKYQSIYNDSFDACGYDSPEVYLEINIKDHSYVDDQKVTLEDNKCFAEDGVKSIELNKGMENFDEFMLAVFKARGVQEKDAKAIVENMGLKDKEKTYRRIRKLKIINSFLEDTKKE